MSDLLLDAMAEQGLEVAFGKRLERIEQDKAGIVAHFLDGSSARGDILIGADGIHSKVRNLILPDPQQPAFTGLVGSGGFVPRSAMTRIVGAGREHEMALCYGDGAFVGYAFGEQREENGAYWWYGLPRDRPLSAEERAALSGEGGVKAVLQADDWSPAVRAILAATTVMAPPFDLYDVASLPRWSSGRAVLIGDAAHAVSPHSGQGVSMALEDAIILARTLRDHGFEAAPAFAAFEQERRPRTERVIAMGRQASDRKRQGRFGKAVQRLLAPLFLRLAPPPRWLFGYEADW